MLSIMQKMFVANKAFIENEKGEVLMLKDSGKNDLHSFHAGLWDIPGGRMNIDDKSLFDGLKREVLEESGVEIEKSRTELFSQLMWDVGDNPENRIAAFIYRVKVGSVNPKCSDEHVEFEWVDPRAIDVNQYKPKIAEALGDYLKKYA